MEQRDTSDEALSSLQRAFNEARLTGFEYDKQDFIDLYHYSRLVLNEYKRIGVDDPTSPMAMRSKSSTSFRVPSTDYLPEVSWMHQLNQIVEGSSIVASEPNTADALSQIRQRRLQPSAIPVWTLPEDYEQVLAAFKICDSNLVLVEKFAIPITPRDLFTLSGKNWLNDEIVNFYFELVADRSHDLMRGLPKIHIFNTFFYPKLRKDGFAAVRRWTRKVDIFAVELVLIPIHLGVHWCSVVMDFSRKEMKYFDSLHGNNLACLDLFLDYLIAEYADKKGGSHPEGFFDSWSLSCPKKIPCQQNGYDCGVFACLFAEFYSRKADFSFSQRNIPLFRKRMAYEILTGKLLI